MQITLLPLAPNHAPAICRIFADPSVTKFLHGFAELEYALNSRYAGQGIMPMAIMMLTAEAFEGYPHLIRIQCSIASDNRASRKAVEKAGYVYEATLIKGLNIRGSMADECIYACLRGDDARQLVKRNDGLYT
jgi:[ribosomal protein S5]-alanine N-acetyltransferase